MRKDVVPLSALQRLHNLTEALSEDYELEMLVDEEDAVKQKFLEFCLRGDPHILTQPSPKPLDYETVHDVDVKTIDDMVRMYLPKAVRRSSPNSKKRRKDL